MVDITRALHPYGTMEDNLKRVLAMLGQLGISKVADLWDEKIQEWRPYEEELGRMQGTWLVIKKYLLIDQSN